MNTSIVNTTTNFDENGSVVVDSMKTEDNNGGTSRTIVKDDDVMATPHNGSTSYPTKRTRNQRWLSVVLGVFLLLCFACGIYFFLQSKQKSSSKSNDSGENTTPITEEELSLHSDKINDCWILIDNDVYDVTQYAPSHPGGPEYITDFCGSNATKDYYINHPVEYLQIYLSSDAKMGVISTNITKLATTDTNVLSENNSTISTDDKLEDAADDDITSRTPTLVPTLISEPSSVPSSVPSSAPIEDMEPSSLPTVINEPSSKPTLVNETTFAPNFTAGAPTSRPIAAVSAPISIPIAPTPKPIAPTSKPITPTTKPIAPTMKPITPTMKPITPTVVPTIPVPSCISIDEVALHNSIADCYYILYDYVYDVTNYVDIHPGGSRKIFQECGTDATAVYITEKNHDEALLLEVNAIELYGLGYAC